MKQDVTVVWSMTAIIIETRYGHVQ